MGGSYSWGARLDNLIPAYPQYPVARRCLNPFKLCDFPLVTLRTLLY
jgi:hypothetical protein